LFYLLLATQCPRTLEEFGMVSGIGEYKKERYGKDFVEAINLFLKQV
jgi:ATP-dependent DNA helicase RecQ